MRALAREGRLFWIFDGLDEVIDEEQRRRYAEMIAGLCDEHPECRVLVTSRPAGAEIARPLLEGAGLATYALQAWDERQRDEFLDAWHSIVFVRDPDAGLNRRERFASAVTSTPSLAALCKNPLLCAMLAYLNREKTLPQRRHRLYQEVLERMAEHWDANKGLPSRPDVEKFDLESKLLFLRQLAWQMIEEPALGAKNMIQDADLERFAAMFCEERWAQAPDTARRTAEALLRQLRERNSVVAFFGGTIYGFAHRAFLEYLAALEMYERYRARRWELEDLGKLFASRWRHRAWEETLMLLGGLLQDSSPEAVIYILQDIPGRDIAQVHGSLPGYLDFCIKALGEIRVLDGGTPLEFVTAIGDLIEFQIRNGGNIGPGRLKDAFRRCGDRWPWREIERLLLISQDVGSSLSRSRVDEIYVCLLSAAGTTRRLQILMEALDDPGCDASSICAHAAYLGPWSEEELSVVCRALAGRVELDRCEALSSVVSAPGAVWSDGAPPIVSLSILMSHSADPVVRHAAASGLLKANCHRDHAIQCLCENLGSSDDDVAISAAVTLVHAGYWDDWVIDTLARCAPKHSDVLAWLIELARVDADAKRALVSAAVAIREHAEPQDFVHLCAVAEQHGFSLASHEEILDRLRSVDEPFVKVGLLLGMRAPSLGLVVVHACNELWNTVPRARGMIPQIISVTQPRYRGPAFVELGQQVALSNEPSVSIPVAGRLMRTASTDRLRNQGRQTLINFLDEGCAEAIRLQAARQLGINDAAGSEACHALAKRAQDENVRLEAARAVGDLESLNELAERGMQPAVRKKARHALELYAHISSLLRVGRPGRARVLLHGRRVGRLEETSAGGGTRFTYAADYLAASDARPLAPNLPLRPQPYPSDTLHPFFANLLPEGPLFDQTARRLGLRRTDRFGMLLKVGADVMGAVQVLPEEDA